MPHTRSRTLDLAKDAANSRLHSTCSCLICWYNTGDPLCSGERDSGRVTPNRRHFLDARGDTPGCQALLELGIREHERENFIVKSSSAEK
ncbi:unnamed protein product [Lasius platythorax]|uniref:Uncharacterized protein n=1 Tax=Lasius platythorax TaxID=488582 RepID=A0AAV2N9K6_9HYME